MVSVVLPPVAFAFLWIRLRAGSERSRRLCAIEAALVCSIGVALATELLSMVGSISRAGVLTFWSLFLAGVLVTFRRQRLNPITVTRAELRGLITDSRARIDRWDRLVVASIAFIIVLTFMVAVIAPPNNWDSMTYHMSRIMHWIQDRSLKFYPTTIVRQNYMPPMAEELIQQLQVLSGGDRFANVVQWSAFVLSIFAVSYLTALTGGGIRAQSVSALLAATMPMAILQSTSTQNDLVAGLFLLAFVAHLLRFADSFLTRDALFASAALGLGLLTKGTIFIFGAAAIVSLGALIFSRMSAQMPIAKMCRLTTMAVLIVVVLNAGYWVRNVRRDGHPLGRESSSLRNQNFDIRTAYSNLVRNAAIHLATPSIAFNDRVQLACESLLGDALNDPSTTWNSEEFQLRFLVHEDISGDLVQFVLITVSVFAALLRWPRITAPQAALAATVLSGFLLYCVLLKWQPWASRLHTPVLLLGLPLVATGLFAPREDLLTANAPTGFLAQRRTVPSVPIMVGVLAFLWAQPFLWRNQSRPLIPTGGLSVLGSTKSELLFANRPDLRADYERVVEYIRAENSHHTIDRIVLVQGEDDWEYPICALLADAGIKNIPIHAAEENVAGDSASNVATIVFESRLANFQPPINTSWMWKGKKLACLLKSGDR